MRASVRRNSAAINRPCRGRSRRGACRRALAMDVVDGVDLGRRPRRCSPGSSTLNDTPGRGPRRARTWRRASSIAGAAQLVPDLVRELGLGDRWRRAARRRLARRRLGAPTRPAAQRSGPADRDALRRAAGLGAIQQTDGVAIVQDLAAARGAGVRRSALARPAVTRSEEASRDQRRRALWPRLGSEFVELERRASRGLAKTRRRPIGDGRIASCSLDFRRLSRAPGARLRWSR
jgi:hypothetical protein